MITDEFDREMHRAVTRAAKKAAEILRKYTYEWDLPTGFEVVVVVRTRWGEWRHSVMEKLGDEADG